MCCWLFDLIVLFVIFCKDISEALEEESGDELADLPRINKVGHHFPQSLY